MVVSYKIINYSRWDNKDILYSFYWGHNNFPKDFRANDLKQLSPYFLASGNGSMEEWNEEWGWGRQGEDSFRIIQGHYISCGLYFSCYYISSISDYWALDPGGWGSLPWTTTCLINSILYPAFINQISCKLHIIQVSHSLDDISTTPLSTLDRSHFWCLGLYSKSCLKCFLGASLV